MNRWLGTMLLLTLVACAGPGKVPSDLHIEGAPDWVNEGTRALENEGGRVFHGVGSAPPMESLSLQKATADDRARAALVQALGSYVEVVQRDYAGHRTGDDSAEEEVSRVIESASRMNLSGARIVARWRDPKTDIVYALAELDLEQAREVLRGVQDMSPDLKDHLRQRGATVFDDLAEESP